MVDEGFVLPLLPKQQFTIDAASAGTRLDRYLAEHLPEVSRTRIQELIVAGLVTLNGATTRAAHRLAMGDRVEVEILPRPPLRAVPEAIPLDILYEDADVVVVNKPSGMAVHAGAGATTGTIVNALLHRYGQLSDVGGEMRPGIVHRLDKLTSGVLVVARNDAAHCALAEQFRRRAVEKTYLALLHGRMKQPAGRVELPVARDLRRRTRMTARRREGRAARTDWRALLALDGFTLVEAKLLTGRTHQIRVHFSALGHPVVGDVLYGAPRQARAGRQNLPPLGRNFLHAARICFQHPRTGAPLELAAPLPAELREYFTRLAEALGVTPAAIDAALRGFL